MEISVDASKTIFGIRLQQNASVILLIIGNIKDTVKDVQELLKILMFWRLVMAKEDVSALLALFGRLMRANLAILNQVMCC